MEFFKNIKNINTHLIRLLVLTTLSYALKNKRAYLKFGVPLSNLSSSCWCSPPILSNSHPGAATNTMQLRRVCVCVCMCSATHTRQLVGTHTIESSPVRSREIHPRCSISLRTKHRLSHSFSPPTFLHSLVWSVWSPINQYSSSPIRLDISSHRQTNTQQCKTPAKLTHLISSLPCM